MIQRQRVQAAQVWVQMGQLLGPDPDRGPPVNDLCPHSIPVGGGNAHLQVFANRHKILQEEERISGSAGPAPSSQTRGSLRVFHPLFSVRQQPRSGSVDKTVRELQQQQLMNSGKKSSSLRNIWSKKLEGSRSSNSGRTQQRKRHQMMDDVFQPRLVLPADVKEEAPEEQSPDVDQQEPEPLQIKEEQEELWTSQEGEQLTVKEETDTRFPLTAAPIKNVKEEAPEEQSPDMDQQELELLHIKEENERIWSSQDEEQLNVKKETDYTRFPVTVVHMKSEEDEEKPLFSQLHQHQTEDRDLPRSISNDQIKVEIKEEDCGTSVSSRNPDLNTHGGSSNYSETEDGEDDEEDDDVKHHESELKHLSDSETEDSEDDWKESRTPGSGRNTVNKYLSCSECGGKFANRRSLQSHMTCHPRLTSSDCSGNETCFREKKNIDSLTKFQTGSKDFNCGECGKSFNLKRDLKRHTKVHTGDKPFSCDACGKRFACKSYLNTHMRIHTGDKPVSCDTSAQKLEC
ncbi:zinc finger protein 436-like [Girardinichthys multiradiatus]|uniref:zinc finger protein 436-like n=1 Tax=Girardinichthys multiradiatus TaxID=208333 RepID=UPI001FAD4050|nr:zinc finger protein 436-like [Girardinichthys multiradiatus]